jgi:glutathione S-transferase
MQLIGMPDSAFVRRVAITMQLLALPYEHHAISARLIRSSRRPP